MIAEAIKRLEKLEKHMKGTLGHKKFYFGVFNANSKNCVYTTEYDADNKCGTMGCMAGELPIMDPTNWKFSGNSVRLKVSLNEDTKNDLMLYFGLSSDEAGHLFYPEEQCPHSYGGKELNPSSSKADVVSNLSTFIKLKKLENESEEISKQISIYNTNKEAEIQKKRNKKADIDNQIQAILKGE